MELPGPPELSDKLFELRLSLGPGAEQTAERDTVPVKPLMLARLMVTVPEVPAARRIEAVLVARLKSSTRTVMVTPWLVEPLVPVTVTV